MDKSLCTIVFGLFLTVCFGQVPETDIYLLDIKMQNGGYYFSNPVNITNRPGYDNQPYFSGNNTILYVSYRDTQADIYRYDVGLKSTTQITNTHEDEYSPQIMPDGKNISTVRVERDSTQRLWCFFPTKKDPRLILPDIKNVAYYAWINKDRFVFQSLDTKDTFNLKVGNLVTGTAELIAKNVGRCILKIPGTDFISFIQKKNNEWVLEQYDPASGIISDITKSLEGIEDYAWTPDGKILMGKDGQLFYFDLKISKEWVLTGDFRGSLYENFYRIAVSPDGKKLALVTYAGKHP